MFRPRRRMPGSVNPNGWMMSYADMVTILLSMFIVLTTLGKDQTGARFNQGIDSYRQASNSFGLPGLVDGSRQAIPLGQAGPRHPADGGEKEPDDPAGRSIDAELERLQHCLKEMNRLFQVDKLPPVAGQAAVDFFDRLNPQAPYLKGRHSETIGQIAALLPRGDFRVDLIVWATTPSDTAWARAAEQAQALADEIATARNLDPAARTRLVPLGRPWLYADYARPVFTLVVVKTAKGGQ